MATHSRILAGAFHGQRSRAGYSPRGRQQSDRTERLPHPVHCAMWNDVTHSVTGHGRAPPPAEPRPQDSLGPGRGLPPAWGLDRPAWRPGPRPCLHQQDHRSGSISVSRGGPGRCGSKSECREKALFFVGRSLRGAGAPLPAPPLPQRNKTAAIFRFVSNSLRPWGGESRERGICEGSNERQQPYGPTLQAAGPHLRQGRSQPRMFLRQREARDNENNARAPGCLPVGEHPPTYERRSHWAQRVGMGALLPWLSPRGTSKAPFPGGSYLGRGGLVPDSAWALGITQTSCDGQLCGHPAKKESQL